MLEALAWAPLQANAEEVAAATRAMAAIAAQVRMIMKPPVQQTLASSQRDRKGHAVQDAVQLALRPNPDFVPLNPGYEPRVFCAMAPMARRPAIL
jgi:hypothetical protein